MASQRGAKRRSGCKAGFVKRTETIHKLVHHRRVTKHETVCVPAGGGGATSGLGGSGSGGGGVKAPPSAPPAAVADSYTVQANGTLAVAAPGVLGNDHGDGLGAVLISGVANGTLTFNRSGGFSYTPDAGFTGSDSFTYKDVDASFNSSNTTTVTIAVTPLAESRTYAATSGTQLGVASPGVLAGDIGSGLSASLVAGVSHGTLALHADGSFDYSSTPGFVGDDSFTYRATDAAGGASNVATVTIDVGAAGAPDVVPQTFSGAVGNTELQVGGTPGGGPEAYDAGNLLTGDSDPNGGTLTTAAGAITTSAGGTATIASDGSFSYVPPIGFDGVSDSFTYEVDSSEGDSSEADATIDFVSGRVWYVNDALQANGNGSSGSPFDNLASAAGAAASGDVIFLFASATPYPGGITLGAGETLRGQSGGLTVDGETLLAASGSAPQITNASGAGVTLSSGDTVGAVTISATAGNGVSATNVGAFTLQSSVTISDAGADGLYVSGGAGTIDVAASISGSGAHSVAISGRSGGTATLSGPIDDSADGVLLTANTGATIDFSGVLTASTGTQSAFTATGGGTVELTGGGSSLTTSTGTALDVENTTIGAGGLNFQSISAGGPSSGPAQAIVLENTGSAGDLIVSGDGSAGSGGTIESSTASGAASGAISLSGVEGAGLNYLTIEGSAGNAIYADNVADLAVVDDAISGGADGVLVNGDGSVAATLDIGSNTLSGQSGDAIDVNVAGDDQGTIDSNTIGTSTPGSGSATGDGIDVSGSANKLTLDVEDNTIESIAEGDGIAGAALADGTVDLTVEDNEVTLDGSSSGDGLAYVSSGSGSSALCLDTSGNTASAGGSGANGESVELDSPSSYFTLEGYSGASGDLSAVQSFLATTDTLSGGGGAAAAAEILDANTNGFSDGTCTSPSGSGGIS